MYRTHLSPVKREMKNPFPTDYVSLGKNLTHVFREAMPLTELDTYCLLPRSEIFY